MPVSKASKQEKAGKKEKKPRGGASTRFKKNDPETGFKDPRINRNGANAKISIVRDVLNKLFEDKIIVRGDDGKPKAADLTQLQAMLMDWIVSRDYNKQRAALEYYAGKVPDELHMTSDIEGFIKSNLDLFTDGQLTRLQQGENPLNIIAELLRESKNKNSQA